MPDLQHGDDTRFYDDRYQAGYMEEWPAWKRQRIAAIVDEMRLPARGRALDFGCGQGVFTQVVKETLPGWDVYGCDMSSVAVELAGRRFPTCRFFAADRAPEHAGEFDLVLSHHVLEHVGDLRRTFAELARYAAPSARMIHVLPCGDAGSLEHRVAQLRAGGIDPRRGNRFWFEDVGHLRRLTTTEMVAHLEQHGFRLRDARYANQRYGAIEWITGYPREFVSDFADPGQARDPAAKAELARLRRTLLLVRSARERRHAAGLTGKLPALVGKTVDWCCTQASLLEWRLRSRRPGGSEMYLTFER